MLLAMIADIYMFHLLRLLLTTLMTLEDGLYEYQ